MENGPTGLSVTLLIHFCFPIFSLLIFFFLNKKNCINIIETS